MKKLKRIKLNDYNELNEREMKNIVGGARIVGLRFYNGTCYCDVMYSSSNSNDNTIGVVRCDQPCQLTLCEEAGIKTGIGVL